LKEVVLPKVQPANIVEEVSDQLQAGKVKHVVEQVDLTTLAPRKPDWDLKRDVAKKLDKLERQTQKAIAELIRDRLLSAKNDEEGQNNENIGEEESAVGQVDLVAAVEAGAQAEMNERDDDDDDDDESDEEAI
jgi:hypothetical protein